MATIKCYSGGKCVKTFRNIKEDDLDVSPFEAPSRDYAIISGFNITSKTDGGVRCIIFEWRGDFLVEWR